MFYSLPAETVFEAKQRTKRATFLLFFLLIVLYVFFADLMALSVYLMLKLRFTARIGSDLPGIMIFTTLTAAVVAAGHFMYVRNKSLEDMLSQIQARPADPGDTYHDQFIHIVAEAGAATGIRGIQPVVLSTPGCNAFSLQDSRGGSAIGATEGLLSKLTRGELSAVVAHEAAHLLHEDTKLVTTASFLFSVFGDIHSALGRILSSGTSARIADYGNSYGKRIGGGGGSLIILVLWQISGVGYFLTRLISMAISREREYLADADGVQMCKDPLSLAEGLYKISHRYRGDMPDTYSAVFIMDPNQSELAEQEGLLPDLFSTHPPVSKRLTKLLNWAKSDVKTLQEAVEREEKAAPAPGSPVGTPLGDKEPAFMTFQNNQWMGPYTPLQLLTAGIITPSSWVCPAGSQEVTKASETAELLPLFQKQVQGAVTQQACPRCKVPLMEIHMEGAEAEQCSYCKGHLLKGGVLERLITREEITFLPEDIRKARIWRDVQKGPLKDRDPFPDIQCPFCESPMGRSIHSILTQVVINHCSDDQCGAIWCDGGELETILMLIQDAHSGAGKV